MSARTASRLAWALCSLSLALTALSCLLFILNLSYPNTHLYDPWLDNTLTAVFYPTVGALVASRRPENPVGWLLCLYGVVISISYFCAEYAIYALLAQPNSLPAGEAMAWIASWCCPSSSAFRRSYTCCSPRDGYRAVAGDGRRG
jgi:two-component system NarL family sensor kinase